MSHRASAIEWESIAGHWAYCARTADVSTHLSQDQRDDVADFYEQRALQAMRNAHSHWRLSWAETHCVEHADCEAHPSLAEACLARRAAQAGAA